MLPPIVASLLNVLLSSLTVGAAVFFESGDWTAAALAALGSLANHLRSSPEIARQAMYVEK